MVRIGLAVILFLFTRSYSAKQERIVQRPGISPVGFLDWRLGCFRAGGAKPVAHVSVDRNLDGCALHEHYEDTDGHHGQSFSTYEAGRKQWRQSWYTNHGKSLEMVGNKENDLLPLRVPTTTAARNPWYVAYGNP